jgi:photosystem II stability/assembly factor-like uncharacterized protein
MADNSVTAVHIDKVQNFLDYPLTAIVWFGTQNGRVYKSIDSGASFSEIYQFSDTPIVDIRANEFNSLKVLVAAGSKLYKTEDGGGNWIALKDFGSAIKSFYVDGDEIQVVGEGV